MLNKIKNSPVMVLTTWTVLAQVITFIVSPITTRVYSPNHLGLYTLISSIVSMAIPILALKFDSLIVSEKQENKVYIATIISVHVMIWLSILIVIMYYIYSNITNLGISVTQIALLFGILIVTGISNLGVAFANREEKYNLIGKYNFLRTLMQNILLVLLGYLGYMVNGMLFSLFVGNLFGLASLLKIVPFQDIFKLKRNNKNNWNYFRENSGMIKYSVPAHLINSLSYTILNFLITALYGTEIFGYYSLSFRILGLPLTLITQNVSKVFLKSAALEWNLEDSVEKSLNKYTFFLVLIAIPFTILIYLLGPSLFGIVFGSGWEITGEYVRILSIMFGVRLVVSSLMNYFIIVKKQSTELKFQLLFLCIAILTYLLEIKFNFGIKVFLRIISVGYTIVYGLIFIYIYINKSKKHE